MAKKRQTTWFDTLFGPTPEFTKKDAAIIAASTAYIVGALASCANKKQGTQPAIEYRTPFVFPGVKETATEKATMRYHESMDFLKAPAFQKLINAVKDATKLAFNLADIDPSNISVTMAPKVIRVSAKINPAEASGNIPRKITPYLKNLFDCENIVATQSGASILIDYPRRIYEAVLGDFFLDKKFAETSKTSVAIGCGANGNVFFDVAKMPHMLIAGTTGSGKSVFMHTLILSLLMKNTPQEIELYMVDPKMTEYDTYSILPYCHVVQSTADAVALLSELVAEMKSRYSILSQAGARDIDEYNAKMARKMPRKVLFIDELSQLMSDKEYKKQAEGLIVQLAQLARASGIHLILATQRPTVNVVTGLIKANIECRVALKVNSRTDSMVILDQIGAEKLVGHGDMLFLNGKDTEVQRLQGALVITDEICNIIMMLYKNVAYDGRRPTTSTNRPTAEVKAQRQATRRNKKGLGRLAILGATMVILMTLGADAKEKEMRRAEKAPVVETPIATEPVSGTWSNEGSWSNSTEEVAEIKESVLPDNYDERYIQDNEGNWIKNPEFEGWAELDYYKNLTPPVEEVEPDDSWLDEWMNREETVQEEPVYVVNGPYTVSAEPQNNSIDEYTISDAYVTPRIRTRDRTFVSHIDELHFTDD